LRENALSIFAIQIMEKAFCQTARFVQNRDQALHVFSLILNLRAELEARLAAVERELAAVPSIVAEALTVYMQFERTFERDATDQYLSLLGSYCDIVESNIVVRAFKQGSTTVDFIILTAASLAGILRFLKCSLSLATITLKETTKLRKAYNALKDASPSEPNTLKRPRTTGRRRNAIPSSDSISRAIIGPKADEARSLEIFVDKAKEKVLVVDGRVTITICVG
jgi:hypothetical protein